MLVYLPILGKIYVAFIQVLNIVKYYKYRHPQGCLMNRFESNLTFILTIQLGLLDLFLRF